MLEKLISGVSVEEANKALDSFMEKYEPFLIEKNASIGIRKDEKFGFYLGVTPTTEELKLLELPDYEDGVPVLLRDAEDVAVAFKKLR